MTEFEKKRHVLITGTGRAGTTFLVKLLTRLDVDTGFSKDFISADGDVKAGLEHQGLGGDLPYVVKNPKLMWQLPELLREHPVIIDHILIPMREIHAAAESRRARVRENQDNVSPRNVVGGLEGVDDPAEQEAFFLQQFFHFFEFVSACQIPVTLLHYPRLVYDGEYLYHKLRFLLGGVSRERFLAVFNEVADPSLVNQYNERDLWISRYDDTENIRQLQLAAGQAGPQVMQLETALHQMRSNCTRLEKEKEALQLETEQLRLDNQWIRSSRSWRYTCLFRFLAALVRLDKQYVFETLQKIESVIWKFRQKMQDARPGLSRGLIEPVFKFFKALVKPVFLRITSYNEQWQPTAYRSRYEPDQDFSAYSTDARAIAFYQPQYTAAMETEPGQKSPWAAVKTGEPLFKGHYQPREPHDDIGFYDAGDVRVLKKQAALARRHGIYGFCFFSYCREGKRRFSKPLEMLLEHPEIDLPFCLCWENEWMPDSGRDEPEPATARKSADPDAMAFIRDAVRYLKDPRYIKAGGKPVVMIYAPLLLADPAATFARWRQHCWDNGIGDIAIWVVRGAFNQDTGLGLAAADAEVEFPPNLTAPVQWVERSILKDNQLKLPLADYQALVRGIIAQQAVADKLDCPVYRTVMPGWDNTAQRKEMARVFWGFTAGSYYKWLRYVIEDTRRKFAADERFIFINAWNEWSKGAYLEPDRRYGYATLNTTAKALYDLPFSLGRNGVKKETEKNHSLAISELVSLSGQTGAGRRVAVHAHVYYPDLLHELIYYMNHIPQPFDCYVTTDTEVKKEAIAQQLADRLEAQTIELRVTPNVGRDVAPFLVECRDLADRYDYVCHIHTKKTPHRGFGESWREHLLDHLLGSGKLVNGILAYLETHDEAGLIFPRVFSAVDGRGSWGDNRQHVQALLQRLGLQDELPEELAFPAGTMFWMRTRALENLFRAGITYEDFEAESGQLDGTLAHAFERAVVCIARHNGYCCLSLV